MEACKKKKIESVKILFKANDLDFRYRDKNGKNAIDILRESLRIQPKSTEIQDKDEYLLVLLDLMNTEKETVKKSFPESKTIKKIPSKKKSSDFEVKSDISIDYGTIKFNDQSPSFNKNSKVKLEFYNESFTEKPKSSIQNQISRLEPEIRTRRRVRDEMFSNEEENFMNQKIQPNFAVDQNQMFLHQQQQQRWFQMIQMNNSMQAQISMQMMSQANIIHKQTKKKKRSKK